MYKAVFIDIDGTLLRDDLTIGEATRRSIQRVYKKNISVILVSARLLDSIVPVSKAIGTNNYPAVCLNGSYIAMNEETTYRSVIDPEIVIRVQEQARQFNTTIVYYLERERLAEANTQWTEYEQQITDARIKIDSFSNMIKDWKARGTGPNKILIMGDVEQIRLTENLLQSLFYDQLHIYASKPTYLEIINKDASKWSAIRFLINRFNISTAEVIAIGDNFNDKEMISFAGMGVAMGNAPAEIKEVAKFITDTNNNDGVGKVLDILIP